MIAGRRLVIDTATTRTVVRLAGPDGAVTGRDAVSRKHGDQLLDLIDTCFGDAAHGIDALSGIVVGTGPGSFTGLRVGLAAAKTIAYARHLPIVGIPTAAALGVAALERMGADEAIMVQPAGPSDRYVTRVVASDTPWALLEPPRVVAPGEPIGAIRSDLVLVAVDLDGDDAVPQEARSLGKAALEGLGDTLAALGEARLGRGDRDDVAELVPVYVTLPRGVTEAAASVAWAPDLR